MAFFVFAQSLSTPATLDGTAKLKIHCIRSQDLNISAYSEARRLVYPLFIKKAKTGLGEGGAEIDTYWERAGRLLTLSRVAPSAVSKGWGGLIGPPHVSKGVGVVLVSNFSCNLRSDHD